MDLMDKIAELSSKISKENANMDNSAATKMYQIAAAASKEYILERVLPKNFANAHEKGDIHIHDLDYYDKAINCAQWDLGKFLQQGIDNGVGYLRDPKRVGSAAALTAIFLQSTQNMMFGGQSISRFDEALIPFAEAEWERIKKIRHTFADAVSKGNYDKKFADILCLEETEGQLFQAMEALIANLNTMKARAGNQIPFTSFNFGTDTSYWGRKITKALLLAFKAGLGHGENPLFPNLIFRVKEGVNLNPEDPNYDLFKLAIHVASIRMQPTFLFMDSSFNKPCGEEVGAMGCRTRVIANVNGPEVIAGRGNLSFTTINLPRIALDGMKPLCNSWGLFRKRLDNVIDLVIDQLLHRYKTVCKLKVKDMPFIMDGKYMDSLGLGPEDSIEPAIKNGTLSMGFIGLAETLIALTGKHHGECELSQELGQKIVAHMDQRMKEATLKYGLNFSLFATPAEGLSGRFIAMDKKIFGDIPGVTDKEWYTNSFHVPVDYECSISHKIMIEGAYHKLTPAGHISYVELPYPPVDNLEGMEKIIRLMAKADMGYAGVNFPIDFCSDCNFLGVINDKCPKCGGTTNIKRTRRITGYLSEAMKFNDAKFAELMARVSHGGRRLG